MPDSITVRTCLWFERGGLEAAQFYVSLLPYSHLDAEHTSGEPLLVEFTLGGTPIQILNGGPHFRLNEAASIVVNTADQAETDRLWNALTANGGSESRCGWCKDRWGVSWQVVPRPAIALFSHRDPVVANRAMQALMHMNRIDIAALEAAAFSSDQAESAAAR